MSKCLKNKADMPTETFLGRIEEEEIYKFLTKTVVLFAHYLRLSRNLYILIVLRSLLLNLLWQILPVSK